MLGIMLIKTNKNTIHTNNNTNIRNVIRNVEKDKTRIKKWTSYNQPLVARGEVMEIAKAAIRQMRLEQKRRTVGHPKEYSDAIILVMATYREMFNLTLRAAAGFTKDIFSYFNVKTPSYVTLQRRMSRLNINIPIDRRRLRGGIIGLVDSTGFKVSGEGEWKVKKHGSGKRRTWSKVHYLIDFKSLQILGTMLTGDYYADGLAVRPLLEQMPDSVKLQTVIGDGAYGTRALYKLIEQDYHATLISPPWKNAKISKLKNWQTRNKYVTDCQKFGRDKWKKQIGYHGRSLVETNMSRIKSAFSDKLKSKSMKNQLIEIQIRAALLNQWTNKYMPSYT